FRNRAFFYGASNVKNLVGGAVMQRSISPKTPPLFSNIKKAGVMLMISGVALLGACNGGSGGATGSSGTTRSGPTPTGDIPTGVPVFTNKVSGTVVDKNGVPISGVTI